MEAKAATHNQTHFFNRELSWLEFNQRVLDEAHDPSHPLLERLKFFCITGSNLDEFFEVRVADLKQEIEGGSVTRSADGRTPQETLTAVTRRVRLMVEQQFACWRDELVPALAAHGICFLDFPDLTTADLAWVEHFYQSELRPVLTPLGIDPSHPFPQLLNKSLNIVVQLETTHAGGLRQQLAVVQVPRLLPRLLKLPRADGSRAYLFLSHVVGHYLGDIFPGTRLVGYWDFRVTRNSELYIDEEDMDNLLKAVEDELHNRRKGDAVRLEVECHCPPAIRQQLLEYLNLTEADAYVIDGPLNPARLMAIYEDSPAPELRDPPLAAPAPAALRDQADVFAAIRQRDILLHHPYENFNCVVELLEQAAVDPQVLAIKQTLYRTGGDPRIVGALMTAVKNGKQVAAVVELKARFDEANNILWARRLEEAGVHVVYGLVGYKIHCKICQIIRRDDDGIRRYVHLSTGNYNPTTARIYTDVGLLTCQRDFGEDATNLFNLLTGVCQFQSMRKLLVAPFDLHERILVLIQREAAHARQGLPARIIAKMNSLVDPQAITALYEASQAGVKIDLIVRGTCCLRPLVPGLSENITVRSIVDRFLEHSRIFYFENACQPEIFVGSADWMPRNFFRRIEAVFPIEDGNLRERVRQELLELPLADNVKARLLQADGTWQRVAARRGAARHRSQHELLAAAATPEHATAKPRARAAKSRFPRVKLAPSPFPPPGKATG
ncbi:polyphosphate kinase [Verrucomicrobiota bacterium]|nr:polyphosphate kinase [Verrucomicrobiota bacterium]